jgi:hypothetical protein
MIDFTDPVASSGETDARAFTAANKINTPNASRCSFNFNCAIVRGKTISASDRGTVLEQLAVFHVAICGAAQATFRQPSARHNVGKGYAAFVNRPGAAVDGSLIENPAAAAAGKSEP